jgi:hypothetical protein
MLAACRPTSGALEQQVGIRHDALCFSQELRQGCDIQTTKSSARQPPWDFLKQPSIARACASRDNSLSWEYWFPLDVRGIDCSVHNSSDRPSLDEARITMTKLLDERIDQHQSMDWTYGHRVVRALFRGAPIPRCRQYHCPIDSASRLWLSSSYAGGRRARPRTNY